MKLLGSALVAALLFVVAKYIFLSTPLGEIAAKLKSGADLTYTATYTTTGGVRATIVRQPPNLALIRGDRRYIVTSQDTWICRSSTACTRLPGSPTADPLARDVAKSFGGHLITPGVAAGLLLGAVAISNLKTETTRRTIAGQPSSCVAVDGVTKAVLDEAGLESDPGPAWMSVCSTDAGVLAELVVRRSDGRAPISMKLTKYSSGVAAADAFRPPPRAKVTSG
ncbi:hypothetical protein [Alloactinosynnema sp. L-07]|uniref:hypothetical protein n=1 Tax=Alloactinosynnema sp. L-07 TaxID=1653480 RepID=UPI00065EF47E|nr:hypothetical protein [Alloactinosynnema sp. L-07]CRK58529.1 hypothetical protein [Alloactinosynnema sp. L-07]